MTKVTSVDEYLASVPANYQDLARRVRATIKSVAPLAEERMSYGMPGYYYHGPLVYFCI